ncbi:MAG: YkgJ family cysteine cluster protein [bacterium]
MIHEESKNKIISEILLGIKGDLSSGLLYTHMRINANTSKSLETASFLYALIELLKEKGLISIDELDKQKKQVADRLIEKFVASGIGLMYQNFEYDKYTFEHAARADCEKCLHICQAICCKLPFALSKQDVEERIICWEYGRPYLIAHDADGYCVHLDRKTFRCKAYHHRPVPCRGFDCLNDDKWKIWQNYEKKIMNPELIEKVNQNNQKFYANL